MNSVDTLDIYDLMYYIDLFNVKNFGTNIICTDILVDYNYHSKL